jgi:hypothetical protein
MAYLVVEPPKINYSEGDTIVVISTDKWVNNLPEVHLQFTSLPANGDSFELKYNGNEYLFTVGTNPYIWTLPPPTGLLPNWADEVQESLRQNEAITTDWLVLRDSTGGLESVILRYKKRQQLDVVATSSQFTVMVSIGQDALPDALEAYLQIWESKENTNDDCQLIALHAPYNASDGRADFNLSQLFYLPTNLPNLTSINPSLGLWLAPSARHKRFYLRYADRLGSPVLAESLEKSKVFSMLHGRISTDAAAQPIGIRANLCHAYRNLAKPVSLLQPDWMYFYAKIAATNLSVKAKMTWSSGLLTEVNYLISGATLLPNMLYYVTTGPLQLGILDTIPLTPGPVCVEYTAQLLGTINGNPNTIIQEIRYQTDPMNHPNNLFLLMENGVGGYESVWMRGRILEKYDANRDQFRTERNSTTDLNGEGYSVFELNTGWHSLEYIEHLRQLLLGKLWLIDTARKRFISILCESKSIEIQQTDNFLYSFSLAVRVANFDLHKNK